MNHRRTSLGKTTRPVHAGVLPRTRLFSLFDQLRDAPVLWVSGPPGAGKTIAVSSYFEQARMQSLWYQLDPGDADVATFFYYLRHAAEAIGDGEALPLLTAEYHAGVPAFTRRFFQLLCSRLEPPFALIFDGYHEVPASAPLHEVFRDAVRELPAGGAIVLISRTEAPASFARLRAHGQLREVGWPELRLDAAEIAGLARHREVAIADDALATLVERTEGWAAGVVLLLEQARRVGSIAAPPDLSTRQLIFDYLASEIFQASDERTQKFLLRTSLVAHLTAATAEALTGEPDADAVFAGLHRNNYFVARRELTSGSVYQYHPMFREFLVARAEATMDRETLSELRGTAAALTEAAGYPEDALGLLLEARDWDAAARVIGAHAKALVAQGRGETVQQWVERLPLKVQESHPWVLYWAAASQLQPAPREARLTFERAFVRFGAQANTDASGALLAASGAMYAILYELDDFSLLDRWIAVLDDALEAGRYRLEPDEEARVASSMFMALTVRQPHRRDIARWIELGMSAARRAQDPNVTLFVGLLAALTLMWTGLYRRAFELIEAMQRVARAPGVSPFSLTTLRYLEAMHGMLAADGARALAAMREGLEIARQTGAHTWMFQLLVTGYGGALGAQQLEACPGITNELKSLAGSAGRFNLCQFHHLAAWEAMLRGDLMSALREERIALRMAIEVGCPYFEALSRLALAQILADCGDQRRCIAHLERVREIVGSIDNRHLQFVCLFGSAQIALEHGRQRLGLSLLQSALGLGREYGYQHFLWWCPNRVANVLARAIESGIEVDYAQSLVRARALAPDDPPLALGDWPWAIRIQLFGAFRVLKSDAALPSTGRAPRRPLELLKVLIAHGGEGVGEEVFTEAIWPRIEGDSAHRSFTSTLHRLRKILGESGVLVLHEGKLSLSRRHVWTDVWALEAVVSETRHALAGDATDVALIERLERRLLDLYQGPFLAGEGDVAWAIVPRERLRSRFSRTLNAIGQYWEAHSNGSRALACYRAGIEADPLAESFYRSLILALDRLGHRAEAIEVYQRCRAVCATHGAEPSAETRAVYDRLLAT